MSETFYPGGAEQLPTSFKRARQLFGASAGLSFLLSVSLFFSGSREQGIFVGLWVPSILSAGSLIFAGRERVR